MDTIVIKGLRCLANVGLSKEERLHRQELRIDIRLNVDLTATGDDLDRSVDYESAVLLVEDEISRAPHRLIETVAERIADRLLRQSGVLGVEVRVKKFPASLAGRLSFVAAVIRRGKTHRSDS